MVFSCFPCVFFPANIRISDFPVGSSISGAPVRSNAAVPSFAPPANLWSLDQLGPAWTQNAGTSVSHGEVMLSGSLTNQTMVDYGGIVQEKWANHFSSTW